ncbi:MAG TPA: DegV family protein, partial [Symbiobacteriaceae bacterium]|nr:DegV family protein [Symbiobacteriaceae bacterium]
RPVLQVDREGLVAPADKVRGKSKVLPRSLELMQERVPAGRRIRIAVLHSHVPQEAELWLEAIRPLYKLEECWVGEIGPVIGTNTGPGTVGVCFYEV